MLESNDNCDDKLEHNSILYGKQLLEHIREKMDHCRVPPLSISQLDINHERLHPTMIDLNERPHKIPDQITNSSQVVPKVFLKFQFMFLSNLPPR